MTEQKIKHNSINLWQVVRRSFFGFCPNCGKGKLLKNYIGQIDHCAHCHESYIDIKAEDGPAWLSIILVGHILAPLLLIYEPDAIWPEWVSMTLWPSLAAILSLIILPRAKGLFIGMIWRNMKNTIKAKN
jgi:uncharacterized protein (DUF983 family)